MAYPHNFISMANFALAFTRVVRGQNKEYKNLFRHLYPSYQLGLQENLQDLINDIKAGRYQPSPATLVFQPKKSGILRPLRLLTLQDQIVYHLSEHHRPASGAASELQGIQARLETGGERTQE